jgi:hypothetical protein
MAKIVRADPSKPGGAEYNQAIDIVQKIFPEFLDKIDDVTITPAGYLGDGVNGQYTKNTETNEKKIEISLNRVKDVNSFLRTILHESDHAQEDTDAAKKSYYADDYNTNQGGRELAPGRIGSYDYARTSGLQKKQDDLKSQATDLGLPSVDKTDAPLDEILATMRAVTAMKNKGYVDKQYGPQVDKLMQDPDVANWVARNSMPTADTVKNFEPSTMDKISNFVSSLFK